MQSSHTGPSQDLQISINTEDLMLKEKLFNDAHSGQIASNAWR